MNTMQLPQSTTKWEMVTPELAKDWLIKNKNMRPINKYAVAQYKDEILTGNYRQNGEVIIFDSDGFLRDGQHRLKAIIEAGVAVPLNVVRGVDPDQCDVFDIGGKRTLKQIVGVDATSVGVSLAGRIVSGLSAVRIVPGKTSEYYFAHKEDCEWAANVTRLGNNHAVGKKLGCQIAAYLAYRNGVSKDEIEIFFRIMNSNEPKFARECTAPLKVFKILTSEYKGNSGREQIKKLTSIVLQAILDFTKGQKRKWYKPNDDWKQFYAFIKLQDGITSDE